MPREETEHTTTSPRQANQADFIRRRIFMDFFSVSEQPALLGSVQGQDQGMLEDTSLQAVPSSDAPSLPQQQHRTFSLCIQKYWPDINARIFRLLSSFLEAGGAGAQPGAPYNMLPRLNPSRNFFAGCHRERSRVATR